MECLSGVVTDTNCYLCPGGQEDAQHLFISCSYSRFILEKILIIEMGLTVDFEMVWSSLLVEMMSIRDDVQQQIVLLFIQNFVYHIWRERNARAHGNGVHSPMQLLEGILVDLRSRMKSSLWFSKHTCNRLDICSWVFC